jgi:hypothetical protein
LRGIVRGLWDTRPQTHAAGSCVFILQQTWPHTIAAQQDWANGVTLYMKPQPYTDGAVGDLADFNQSTVALVERARRPFAVSSVLADGVGNVHGPAYNAAATVRISWIPRRRGLGCGFASNPQGAFDPDIATEGDFVVRIYGADGTTLLRTFIVAAGTEFTDGLGVDRHYVDYDTSLDSSPSQWTAKVTNRVNGWESRTSQDITVTRL